MSYKDQFLCRIFFNVSTHTKIRKLFHKLGSKIPYLFSDFQVEFKTSNLKQFHDLEKSALPDYCLTLATLCTFVFVTQTKMTHWTQYRGQCKPCFDPSEGVCHKSIDSQHVRSHRKLSQWKTRTRNLRVIHHLSSELGKHDLCLSCKNILATM